MTDRVRKIAVIQGAPSPLVQDLFRMFVARWQRSARIAGVIAEDHGLADRACTAGFLRSLGSDEVFRIFQDLGAGSTACHLDGAGVLAAAGAAQREIARGCDLVLLSKFGKLEAEGRGLRDAFGAAIESGVPVLTSVSTNLFAAWEKFADPLFVVLPADLNRIEEWWHGVQPRPFPEFENAARFARP
jgi:hypothetical protein